MSLFQRVKETVNIVEHISKYAQDLKQSGKLYKCRCPFHEEHTPSFVVYPDGWYCYGSCQCGGSIIDFEAKRQSISPMEAAKSLCAEYNIPISGQDLERYAVITKKRKEKEAVAQWAVEALEKKPTAMDYFKSRGWTPETVKKFGLGCSLEKEIVVFPIQDTYGKVVAFAQRILNPKPGEGKYKNDSTDEIYQKSSLLYNFNNARRYITPLKYLIINEGYPDVISWDQCGYPSAVAICSAVLTKEQAILLKDSISLDTAIYFVVTNDETARANFTKNRNTVKTYFPEVHTRVITCPSDVKDVNDTLVKYGVEKVRDIFNSSLPSDVYLVQRVMETEPLKEKQYVVIRDIVKHAENLLIVDDVVNLISQKWGKDTATIREFLKAEREVDVSKLKTFPMLIDEYDSYVTNIGKNKIALGWKKLDEMIRGGMRPGDVLQIISAAGVGKTTMAENIIRNICAKYPDVPVIFFSLEQTGAMVLERFLMMDAPLTGEQVERWYLNPNQEERDILHKSVERLSEVFSNLIVVDESNMSLSLVEDYCNQAGMYVFKSKPKVIVIDYLGYLTGSGKSVYEVVSSIAKEQKRFAKKGYYLISLHQVTKEGKTGGEPIKSYHARDSGVVLESADIMLSAWRPELAEKLSDSERKNVKGLFRVEILKNRYGLANKIVDFYFEPQYAQLREKVDEIDVQQIDGND